VTFALAAIEILILFFLIQNLNRRTVVVLGYIISILGLFCTLWICIINFQEIINRLNGQYSFYSQRATLTDAEAVIYFGVWTSLFIPLSFLSLKNLIRKKFPPAIIYGIILLVLIFSSLYIDTLFYHDRV
jgi:hypothetical protein